MTSITRRDALLGVSAAAAAIGGAVTLPARNEATANPVQEPLVSLWQERVRLRAQLDRLSDQCTAIEEALPEWARRFDGITVQVSGCQPRTCRTVEQIDAAMSKRSLFSLDPPSKEAVSAWRAEGKIQRDTWVMELAEFTQRFERERERSGHTAKEKEYEAIWEDIDPIEDQIVDTQAVTMEGVLVQVLLFADLKKDENQQFWDTRLGKSMGIAARRMAPEFGDLEHLSGGLPS